MVLIGVIASMFYVGTLLFSSPLGWASDTFGRKPIMVFGVTLVAIAMVLFTTTSNPYWFILFRLLEGIGTAAVGPAGQAFVADITDDKDRSKAYGILTSAQFGGLIIGPALGAVLLELAGGGRAGFHRSSTSAPCSSRADGTRHAPLREGARGEQGAHPAAPRLERPRGRRPSGRPTAPSSPPPILAFVDHRLHEPLRDGRLRRRAGASGSTIWAPPPTYIAATWTAFSIPMLLSFAGGVLADRHSRFRLMFTGYAFSAVAWILYGVTRDLTLFLIVNVLEGVAIAFSYPAKQAFLVQVSPQALAGDGDRRRDERDATRGLAGHAHGADALRRDLGLRDLGRRRRQFDRTGDRGAGALARVEAPEGVGADAPSSGAGAPRDAVVPVGGEPAAARDGVAVSRRPEAGWRAREDIAALAAIVPARGHHRAVGAHAHGVVVSRLRWQRGRSRRRRRTRRCRSGPPPPPCRRRAGPRCETPRPRRRPGRSRTRRRTGPLPFRPTATAVPSARRPTVWKPPAETAIRSFQDETSHWPSLLTPTATAVPSARRPTVCKSAGRDGDQVVPGRDVALTVLVAAHRHGRAVGAQTDGVEVAGRDGDQVGSTTTTCTGRASSRAHRHRRTVGAQADACDRPRPRPPSRSLQTRPDTGRSCSAHRDRRAVGAQTHGVRLPGRDDLVAVGADRATGWLKRRASASSCRRGRRSRREGRRSTPPPRPRPRR